MFEPVCTGGPSGLADAPRPFVMRAWKLDGKSYQPGESFFIDVHIFDLQAPAAEYFERAFQQLAENGIGANRRRIRLLQVCGLDAGRRATEAREPIALPLDPLPASGSQLLTLRFLTPTELKSEGGIVRDPPFQVVLARARDRVATLSSLYGGGALDLDFRGMAERAAGVRTVSSNLRWESGQRKSSRTHQVHPLGGFIGEVTYEGQVCGVPAVSGGCLLDRDRTADGVGQGHGGNGDRAGRSTIAFMHRRTILGLGGGDSGFRRGSQRAAVRRGSRLVDRRAGRLLPVGRGVHQFRGAGHGSE